MALIIATQMPPLWGLGLWTLRLLHNAAPLGLGCYQMLWGLAATQMPPLWGLALWTLRLLHKCRTSGAWAATQMPPFGETKEDFEVYKVCVQVPVRLQTAPTGAGGRGNRLFLKLTLTVLIPYVLMPRRSLIPLAISSHRQSSRLVAIPSLQGVDESAAVFEMTHKSP